MCAGVRVEGERECRERQDSVACSQSHSLPLHACSAKWLLAHLWASEKQKHRRKGSAKEEVEEAHKKQLQAVVESFQRSALLGVCGGECTCVWGVWGSTCVLPSHSLLEKQGIDFIKTQEEELEKEFEEMRVSGCSVLATVRIYVHIV